VTSQSLDGCALDNDLGSLGEDEPINKDDSLLGFDHPRATEGSTRDELRTLRSRTVRRLRAGA
jgi:hypothetical protein